MKQKTRRRISWSFVAPLAATLAQPGISSVIKGLIWREFTRAGRGYMDEIFISPPSFKEYQDY